MLKDFEHQYIFKEDTEQSKDAQFQACRDAGKEAAYASIGTGDLNSEYTPSPIKDPDIQMEYCNTDDRDYLKDIYLVWGYGIGIIITDVTLYTDTGEIVEGEPEVGRETISGKWLKFTGQNNRSPIRIGSVNLPENIICLKDLTKALSFGSEKCIIEDFDTSHVINMDNAFENCYINGTINLDFTSCKTAKYCFANVCYDDNPTINVSNFNPNIIGDGMYANNNKVDIVIPEFIWRNNYNAPYMFYETKLYGKLVDLYPGYSPKLYSYSFYTNNHNIDYTNFIFNDTDVELNCCIKAKNNIPNIIFNNNINYINELITINGENVDCNLNLDFNIINNDIESNFGIIRIDNTFNDYGVYNINLKSNININIKSVIYLYEIIMYEKSANININIEGTIKCNKFINYYDYNYITNKNNILKINGRIHFTDIYPLDIYNKFITDYLEISCDTNIENYGFNYRGSIDYIDIIQEYFNNRKIILDDCYLFKTDILNKNDFIITYDKTNAIYNKNFKVAYIYNKTNIINVLNPGDIFVSSSSFKDYNNAAKLNVVVNDNRTDIKNIYIEYLQEKAPIINAPNYNVIANPSTTNYNILRLFIESAYSVECYVKHNSDRIDIYINNLIKEINNFTFNGVCFIYINNNSNIKIDNTRNKNSKILFVCDYNKYINDNINVLFNIDDITKCIGNISEDNIINIIGYGVSIESMEAYLNSNINQFFPTNIKQPLSTIDMRGINIGFFRSYSGGSYVFNNTPFILIEPYIIDYSNINFIQTTNKYLYFGIEKEFKFDDFNLVEYYMPNVVNLNRPTFITLQDNIKSEIINFSNETFEHKIISYSVINNVKKINGIKINEANIDNNNGNINNFEECIFDNITGNIDLRYSPNLTQACLDSLVNISSTITSGKTITLHTTAFQKLTEEQKTIISSKMTLVEYIPEA